MRPGAFSAPEWDWPAAEVASRISRRCKRLGTRSEGSGAHFPRTMAATPATCGVAMEVPVISM